ncbi:protein CREG1 isoform X3 [Suncus etruscus]|uniref:protein CREG1 isoform X3 n=1 Tax=Suncus etruscus TaxID=109475 RepID=UPI00210F24AA|nr:protein CREG1 isoform X3 [Suncus etruscus]
MARRARGSPPCSLLAALLASALLALSVTPATGRGGRDHGDWDVLAQLPPLPPREDAARVARFVTHICDWGALATTSTTPELRGQAFADILSLSDGLPGQGSGVPYFYLSPLQQLVDNLQEDANATLTLTLGQTSFCRKNGFDVQNPLCVHTILSGTVIKVRSPGCLWIPQQGSPGCGVSWTAECSSPRVSIHLPACLTESTWILPMSP